MGKEEFDGRRFASFYKQLPKRIRRSRICLPLKQQKSPARGFWKAGWEEDLLQFHLYGVDSLFALFCFVSNPVAFFYLVYQAGNVNEHILGTIVRLDKAESFCFIEKLNCTGRHFCN